MMDLLNNKKVLVLGATGGIGAHLVKLLNASGAIVWIAGRQLNKLQELSNAHGISSAQILQVELADPNSVQLFAEKVKTLSFDIFINVQFLWSSVLGLFFSIFYFPARRND